MNAPVEVWTSLDPAWDRDRVLQHMYRLTEWLYSCTDSCNVHFLHIGGNFGSTKECFVGFEGMTSDGVPYYAYLCWEGLLKDKTVYFEVVPAPGFTPRQMFLKIKGMVHIMSYPRAIKIMRDELIGQIKDVACSVRPASGGDVSDVVSRFPADLVVQGFRRVILYSVFRDAKDGIKRVGLELDSEDGDSYHAFVLALIRSLHLGDYSGGLPSEVMMPQTICAGAELLFYMWEVYLSHALPEASPDMLQELRPLLIRKLIEELKKTGPYECSLISDYYYPWRKWADAEKRLFEKY